MPVAAAGHGGSVIAVRGSAKKVRSALRPIMGLPVEWPKVVDRLVSSLRCPGLRFVEVGHQASS